MKAGLDQVKKIPGVEAKSINITKCNNPTFSKDGTNTLAKKAPQPPACDKKGADQCTTGTGGSKTDTASSGGSDSGDDGTDGAGDGSGTDDGSGTEGGTGGASSADGPVYCEADTGVCANVVALPVEVESESSWGMPQTFMVAAVLLLIGLVVLPPTLGQFIARRKNQS